MSTRLMTLAIIGVTVLAVGMAGAPSQAKSEASAGAHGLIPDELDYGFFYGTFDRTPNVALFAGGETGEFCFGYPGTAPLRVLPRNDGTVDLKVNDKDQPICLHHTEFNDIPARLVEICLGTVGDGVTPPDPFATGDRVATDATRTTLGRRAGTFEDMAPKEARVAQADKAAFGRHGGRP